MVNPPKATPAVSRPEGGQGSPANDPRNPRYLILQNRDGRCSLMAKVLFSSHRLAKKMETDAWDLTTKVMTASQREEFKDLILDWYSANPGQVAVDYIRFSDFGDIGKSRT
jgi:hypothetical protein